MVDIIEWPKSWNPSPRFCKIPVDVGDMLEIETSNNRTVTGKVVSIVDAIEETPFLREKNYRKVLKNLSINETYEENKKMNNKFMIPEIKIVKIRHGMGYEHIALCPKEAELDDMVVYERQHDRYGTVMSVGTIVEFSEDLDSLPNSWVIQKIEKDSVNHLKEKQLQSNELFKKMELRSKQLEGINKFSLLAQADSEMADLLQQFTETIT